MSQAQKPLNQPGAARGADPAETRYLSISRLLTSLRLQIFIYDYFMKRGLRQSADALLSEANIANETMPIERDGSLLQEWFTIFWDVYFQRLSAFSRSNAPSGPPQPQAPVQTHPLQGQPQNGLDCCISL